MSDDLVHSGGGVLSLAGKRGVITAAEVRAAIGLDASVIDPANSTSVDALHLGQGTYAADLVSTAPPNGIFMSGGPSYYKLNPILGPFLGAGAQLAQTATFLTTEADQTVAEYGHVFNMVSSSGYGADTGAKTNLALFTYALPNSGNVWGAAFDLQLSAGTRRINAYSLEIDLNNYRTDYGQPGATAACALQIFGGGPNRSTAAISIGQQGTPNDAANFVDGLLFGAYSTLISDNTILDATSSAVSLNVQGTHKVAIKLDAASCQNYQVLGAGWNVNPTGILTANGAALTLPVPINDNGPTVPSTAWTRGAVNALYFYGFVGDGGSHPLSTVTTFAGFSTVDFTMEQWQALVPQVGALTDEIDGVAIQAALNAQGNNIYGCRISLPANTQARVSRTIQSFGNLIYEGNGSRLIAVGATPFTVIQHGTAASPRAGEVHARGMVIQCNGGIGFDAFFHPVVGAGSGKTIDFKDSTFTGCGSPGFRLTNAPRTVDVAGVTLWTNVYTAGPGFQFVACSYASGTVGNSAEQNAGSFSYTIVDCQTSGFQIGYEFDIVADVSPSAFGAPGGVMEGVIVYSCRAYNGQSFVKVTNSFNAGTSYNYGSPLWTFRDCDHQGSGGFADLSGLTNVLIEGCWPALDESGVGGAGQAPALVEVDMISLAFCSGVTIQNNSFNIFTTASKSTVKCVKTDGYSVNVRVLNNNLAADLVIDSFVHWGATVNANGPNSNVERGTTLSRPNLPTTWCRDDGGNQISEGRVKALGGRLTPDNRTQFVVTNGVVSIAAGGLATFGLPDGLFRQIPAVVSAFNGNYGAYAFPVIGVRSDQSSADAVTVVFGPNAANAAPTQGTNNAAVNLIVEGT